MKRLRRKPNEHIGIDGMCECICDSCKRGNCCTMTRRRLAGKTKPCSRCKWRTCKCDDPIDLTERVKRFFK